MKTLKIIKSLPILCLLFAACDTKKTEAEGDLTLTSQTKKITVDSTIRKFCLSYPVNMQLDSNSFIFYCTRTFDTSSLIHIQKYDFAVRGVFYQMLPSYHQFSSDFADKKNELLFFEGYSFEIDPEIWKMIEQRTNILLHATDSLKPYKEFVDGSKYAIYYNLQSRYGGPDQEILYEDFYTFLKKSCLDKFMQLRKPKAYKSDERRDSMPE